MVDVIIVLGHLMSAEGQLSIDSEARANYAARLYQQWGGGVPIVTCGWRYCADASFTLAQAVQRYLRRVHGVPISQLFLQNESRDTVGDAYFSKVELCEFHHWRTIRIVTSDYHRDRAEEIFRFVFGEGFSLSIDGVPSCFSPASVVREEASQAQFRQTFCGITPGDDAKILERLTKDHPYYNGTVYPKIAMAS